MHSRSATQLPRFLAWTLPLLIKSALALGVDESNLRAPMVRNRSVTSARSAGVARPAGLRPVSVVRLSVVAWETGTARGWCSPKPSGAMQHITEMSKAIAINNSLESLDVAIGHSNGSSAVRQCDLAPPLTALVKEEFVATTTNAESQGCAADPGRHGWPSLAGYSRPPKRPSLRYDISVYSTSFCISRD